MPKRLTLVYGVFLLTYLDEIVQDFSTGYLSDISHNMKINIGILIFPEL